MNNTNRSVDLVSSGLRNAIAYTKGFTIIELMIVVAIVGILSSVAFASYTEQIRKAKRATAADDTISCAALLERRYTLNNSYSVANPSTHCDVINDDNPHYTIGVVPGDSAVINGTTKFNSFVITTTASSTAMLADEQCRRFTYNEQGVKAAYKSDGTTLNNTVCWRN